MCTWFRSFPNKIPREERRAEVAERVQALTHGRKERILRLTVMVPVSNLSTQEAESESLNFSGQSGLCCEFQVNLDYIKGKANSQ